MTFTGGTHFKLLAGGLMVAAVFALGAGLSSLASDRGNESLVALQAAAVPPPASKPATAPAPAPLSEWDKRWWIDKTARLLRGGEGIGPNDDLDRLANLSKEEVAREFMEDERFGDTVLDFNMYFMGFKNDSLKVDGMYTSSSFDFANAISSAQALVQGGDYLKLFDLEGDYYLAPLTMTPSEEKLEPADAKLTPKQLREKAAAEIRQYIHELIAMGTGPQALGVYDLCGEVEEFTEQRAEITVKMFRAFTDAEIFGLMRGGVPEFLFDALDKIVREECEKTEDQAKSEPLVTTLRDIAERFDSAFKELANFEPTVYEPYSVADFRKVDRSAFPNSGKWIAFGYEQGTALANSSTNYNRKRAAYVLKRFFCDDLNPVGFENPKEHTTGAHGSQTSCYSCHYKLDPMAGFFRNYGALFGDASSTPDIVFDDLASVDRNSYLSAWRAPEGAGRTWEVGYIRSPRWKEQNNYGENLSDLSNIIREAPEAKRCLMKRLTEYVVGENQTMDGGYLDALTKRFEEEAKANSSQALKNAMVTILGSQTFQQRNPAPGTCYDVASGENPDNRPPCRVSYILQKNCVQCHASVNDIENTLDLSKWLLGPDGKHHQFPHLNSKSEQVAAQETLTRIASRISSTDDKRRMPKNKPMSSQERQELYLWVQKELARRAAEQPR